MQKVFESAYAVKDAIPAGQTVVLVGGGFDLLHVGHLHLLEYSKTLENVLVVCVLSDNNIRSYKASSRPIIGEAHRAKMVSALRCVDYAYVSDLDTSHQETLSVIQPNSVVFGIENTNFWRRIAGERAQFLRSNFPNIATHYLKRFSDTTVSTSGLIQKILNSRSE